MFNTVLIANRGEIALRIQRACRDLGLARSPPIPKPTVTRRTSERRHRHLHRPGARRAELSRPVGDPARAEATGAEPIHPGYGFLSENADFAEAVDAAGRTFIGPRADASARWATRLPPNAR